MSPKEKADELMRKFFTSLEESLELNIIGIRKKYAKKCALISVNETIKETMLHDLTIYQHGRTAYWENVKKEIEKL